MQYLISYGDGTTDITNHNDIYIKPHTSAEIGTRCEILYLKPNAYNGAKLFWADATNEDHVLPGGGIANGEHFSQSSNGRKRHVMIKTGGSRWTQHRTM